MPTPSIDDSLIESLKYSGSKNKKKIIGKNKSGTIFRKVKIVSTIPEINMWAVAQTNTYKIKNDSRNYFSGIWYFDMYTYSFVNNELMSKCLSSTDSLVPMKNALSEELTHLRWSLIPNLMLSLEKNINEYSEMKLFELEKVFNLICLLLIYFWEIQNLL